MAAVIDLKYLLAIFSSVTITDSFADQVIEKWRTYRFALLRDKESNDLCLASELCAPPVDGKDLGRRVQEISQKVSSSVLRPSFLTPKQWVSNDLASNSGLGSGCASVSTPIFGFPPTPYFAPTSSAGKKGLSSVPWTETIIIDSDVENEKPAVTEKDLGFPTPDSLENRAPMSDQVASTIKKARKTIKAVKPSTSVDEKLLETPLTLSSTRKRRPKVDYKHVHEDKVFDRSDEDDGDFEYEAHDDDERLDQKYEKHYPKLETPCSVRRRPRNEIHMSKHLALQGKMARRLGRRRYANGTADGTFVQMKKWVSKIF